MILIAGGDADPSIACLVTRLKERNLPSQVLRVGASGAPRLIWHLNGDTLEIASDIMAPTALFLRYDVFTYLKDGEIESKQRAGRWYHTLLSWGMAHSDVAMLNRRYGARQTLKPYVLCLAQRLGLSVPKTLISNDLEQLQKLPNGIDGWITKPVDGGEYTQALPKALLDGMMARRMRGSPSIIQKRLVGPELRIYRVGNRVFAFEIASDVLDYRATQNVAIRSVEPPEEIVSPLFALMDALGLDFGAADFKTCPETGEQLFLEVNSMPMFQAFDYAVSGALADAILDWLKDHAAISPCPVEASHQIELLRSNE